VNHSRREEKKTRERGGESFSRKVERNRMNLSRKLQIHYQVTETLEAQTSKEHVCPEEREYQRRDPKKVVPTGGGYTEGGSLETD